MKYKKLINLGLVVMGVAIVGLIISDVISNKKGSYTENPYSLNLDQYTSVDTSEILYSEISSFSVADIDPKAISVSNHKIFISTNNAINIYSIKGKLKTSIELPKSTTALSIADNNLIWVALKSSIVVYSQSGKQKYKWTPFDDKAYITSIAVKGEDIFVADAGNKQIYKCNINGEILDIIGGKSDTTHQFTIPSPFFDINIDDEGYLWAVNPGKHSLDNFTDEGKLRTSWKTSSVRTEGFSGCCNPAYITMLENNYFVTSEKGVARIKIYNQHGEYVGVVASPKSFDKKSEAADIAVDKAGLIYALDFTRKQIRIFEKDE